MTSVVCVLLPWQGITRVKSSSDVVGAVIKELRLHMGQPEPGIRMAVAVDGVNALWGRSSIRKNNGKPVRKILRTHTRKCYKKPF